MGLWFREYVPKKVLLSLGVIAILTVLRIMFSRFSRDPEDASRETLPVKGVNNH